MESEVRLHTALHDHTLDAFLVVAAHESGVVEVAFLRGFLLSQDVTMIGMLSFDFAGTGEGEALLGSGFGFHFRHYFTVFKKLIYYCRKIGSRDVISWVR